MSKLVYRLSVGILAGWLYFAGPGTAAERGLAARWDFEQGNARETLDRASGIPDLIKGYSAYVPGASGRGLRFDGYTTAVVREAGKAPRLANAFTLEAWVAVQAYPWGPCAIISQCEMREAKLQAKEREFTPEEDPTAGYYFAVDADGYVHLEALIGDRWRRCRSRTQVPLMKWTHIAGTWDAAEGLTVYINGEKAGSEPAAGELTYSPDADLEIGRNPVAKPPQYPIRLNIPASYSFDGSIDEVKIHRTALPSSAIRQAYHSGRPKHGTGMSFRKLPRQPRGPAPFGAYYEKLKFDDSWDAPRRDGPKPDVVVLFDEHPHRYIFWRGTGFIPHWVTENDIWYTNEFNETWGHGALGCAEPMSDKQGRFSRVRILEQNDARVVVHWRYALVDNRYHFARVDPQRLGRLVRRIPHHLPRRRRDSENHAAQLPADGGARVPGVHCVERGWHASGR